ncbi:hypothetical protein C0992_010664 [Termitomyces sp. T32_za158]|nr:hypothetical protein C0992_010664 [Termitomyces sp. T32_za158]
MHVSSPFPVALAVAVAVPRTPRTPSASSHTLFSTSNRNSTSSWNSSNPDELFFDWKPDQIRLLTRVRWFIACCSLPLTRLQTLDALPPQLVTPFNGPIPPSNLLDKIARGVTQAKGPVDWPHSLRATRVKLIELSRARALADADTARPTSDVDMDDAPTKMPRKRRPLYKQSSMDFMTNADLRDDDRIELYVPSIDEFSFLTRTFFRSVTDRLIATSNYHPFARRPACFAARSSRTGTSTPSSSTLNKLSSFSANRFLRRTSSNVSTTSASSVSISSSLGCPDPRVQRVRKENIESSPLAGAKRAARTGAGVSGHQGVPGERKDAAAYPSSDEEEKIREKGAKKMRVKELAGKLAVDTGATLKKPRAKAKAPPTSVAPTAPAKTKKACGSDMPRDTPSKSTQQPKEARTRAAAPMSLKRNPSIFGAELPPVPVQEPEGHRAATRVHPHPHQHARAHASPASSGRLALGLASASAYERMSPVPETRAASVLPPSPSPRMSSVPETPSPSPPTVASKKVKTKTLRRVQRVTLGRRISFGSLGAGAGAACSWLMVTSIEGSSCDGCEGQGDV